MNAIQTMNAKELVCTTMLSPRESGGQRYTSVVFDASVSKVAYRVHCAKNGEPAAGVFQSGAVETKLQGEKHAFVIPVTKGMVYFIELCMEVESGESGVVTWVLEPFKRRQVSREELAPSDKAEAK